MSTTPETEQRIREAAFRALAAHGYADLSIKDIGEELGQNPSLIYHYFDSKDDLLLSMLDVFVELFVGRQTDEEIADAEAALRRFVGQVLSPEPAQVEQAMHDPPSEMETAVARVFVELWAHAIWDDDFRRETTRVEDRIQESLVGIIRVGVERGEFRAVDPALTADHVAVLLKQGLHTRATTDRDAAVERVRTLIDDVIDDLVDDTIDDGTDDGTDHGTDDGTSDPGHIPTDESA